MCQDPNTLPDNSSEQEDTSSQSPENESISAEEYEGLPEHTPPESPADGTSYRGDFNESGKDWAFFGSQPADSETQDDGGESDES